MPESLINAARQILNTIQSLENEKNVNAKSYSISFQDARLQYYQKLLQKHIERFISSLDASIAYILENEKDRLLLANVDRAMNMKKLLMAFLQKNNTDKIKEILSDNIELLDEIDKATTKKDWLSERIQRIKRLSLPIEIKDEILHDFEEAIICYNAKAYRSAIILCARILEICLHRKYFELTKVDLLEKSPGIGLGNLIAKLKEKGFDIEKIDPALQQQIHVINQVRIAAVHKKNYLFIPTKEQAEAIILYTFDIVQKLMSC
jgi:hypothetical protein